MRIFLFFLLFPLMLFSQVKGIVRDEATGKPVPYANIWIENQDWGTTADENGNYTLNTTNADKTIIFSAVGYETKKIKLPELKKLALKPVAPIRNEGLPAIGTEFTTIGDYKIRNAQLTYGNHGVPWMLARKFSFDESVRKTPFLKELAILTDSHNEKMVFNLRFFEIGADGNPGKDLANKNILIAVERGKDNTIIDLTPYGIKFPEKGFFIAVEWLMIAQNFKTWYDHRPMQWKDYDPGIGVLPVEKNSTWAYRLGKWMEFGKNTEDVKGYKDKFVEIAMKLTLSN